MFNTPLREKNWGLQGYTFFYYFALKHRLRVLVRTALRGPTISVWSKNKKNNKTIHIKIIILQPFKKSLHNAWECLRNVLVLPIQERYVREYHHDSRVLIICTASRENLSSGFPTRSDTNWAIQPKKMSRGLISD